MCVQATILWLFVIAAPGNRYSPHQRWWTHRASVTLHPLNLAPWPLITPSASLSSHTVGIFLGFLTEQKALQTQLPSRSPLGPRQT